MVISKAKWLTQCWGELWIARLAHRGCDVWEGFITDNGLSLRYLLVIIHYTPFCLQACPYSCSCSCYAHVFIFAIALAYVSDGWKMKVEGRKWCEWCGKFVGSGWIRPPLTSIDTFLSHLPPSLMRLLCTCACMFKYLHFTKGRNRDTGSHSWDVLHTDYALEYSNLLFALPIASVVSYRAPVFNEKTSR